jgi:hypothetical protein
MPQVTELTDAQLKDTIIVSLKKVIQLKDELQEWSRNGAMAEKELARRVAPPAASADTAATPAA